MPTESRRCRGKGLAGYHCDEKQNFMAKMEFAANQVCLRFSVLENAGGGVSREIPGPASSPQQILVLCMPAR